MPRKTRGVQVNADKFVELRKAKEMSQDDLAGAAGVSRNVIVRAEAGKPISIDSLQRIAPKLGTAYKELLKKKPMIDGNLTIDKLDKAQLEKLKQPDVLEAIQEVLEAMAKLKDMLDFGDAGSGSLKIHFRITPKDADRLLARIDKIKARAADVASAYKSTIPEVRKFNEFAEQFDLTAQDVYLALLAISHITEIHIPVSDLHDEVTWREGGDQRESVTSGKPG